MIDTKTLFSNLIYGFTDSIYTDTIYVDTDAIYCKKKGKGKMKESKFKVGDKVIIKDGSKIKHYSGGWLKDMAFYIGRTCTISVVRYDACKDAYDYRMKEIYYTWDERGLAPAEHEEYDIVISIKGNKIEVKCGDACGIAKCSPEDDFDIETGTFLALERLFANMKNIKEGDSVVVTDVGKCYTTYTKWITKNIKDKELIARFRYNDSPAKGDVFHVEKIAKHESWDDMLAFISGIGGCYLISLKGLEKYETGKRKSI